MLRTQLHTATACWEWIIAGFRETLAQVLMNPACAKRPFSHIMQFEAFCQNLSLIFFSERNSFLQQKGLDGHIDSLNHCWWWIENRQRFQVLISRKHLVIWWLNLGFPKQQKSHSFPKLTTKTKTVFGWFCAPGNSALIFVARKRNDCHFRPSCSVRSRCRWFDYHHQSLETCWPSLSSLTNVFEKQGSQSWTVSGGIL